MMDLFYAVRHISSGLLDCSLGCAAQSGRAGTATSVLRNVESHVSTLGGRGKRHSLWVKFVAGALYRM